jgi:hypothetical protein
MVRPVFSRLQVTHIGVFYSSTPISFIFFFTDPPADLRHPLLDLIPLSSLEKSVSNLGLLYWTFMDACFHCQLYGHIVGMSTV